jgi:hypothetical protein
VNLIVNYDDFELGRAAAPRFFETVRQHDQSYFRSSARYSTDAFVRRKLGRAFADARLSQTIYRSFEEGIPRSASTWRAGAQPRTRATSVDDADFLARASRAGAGR